MSEGVSMGTSGTMQNTCSAVKIEVGDPQVSKLKRIGTAQAYVVPEEKTVPVPIEQYANMILSMQKLEDIRSIVQQAGYIGERTNPHLMEDDNALLAIAAIFQGGSA